MLSALKTPSLFLTIFAGLFAGLYALSANVAPVYPDVSRRMELLEQQADDIEVITVGNSHSIGVDFQTLGVRGFHLWRPAGDLFETKYVIENVIPQLSDARCVLLPASYFLLRRDNAATVTTNHGERRRELYATTNSFDFLDGDFKRFVEAKLTPIARPDHWKSVVEALAGRPPDRLPVREDGVIVYFGDTDTLSAASLKTHAEEVSKEYLDLQNEMEAHHTMLVEDTYDTLEEIAQYLQKRDLQLVLFTPPYYTEHTRQFDPVTTEQMKTMVRRFSSTYPNVQYFDLSTDSTITHTPAYYRDSDHLNSRGARVFSDKLKSVMRSQEGSAHCIIDHP